MNAHVGGVPVEKTPLPLVSGNHGHAKEEDDHE
jgi:hypothetical protein